MHIKIRKRKMCGNPDIETNFNAKVLEELSTFHQDR